MQVGTEGEITEENGNDWVKECKATVNNTHFRLVCCDDDANSGSEGYNGDSDNSSEED
ncbi:hypothetical protein H4R18_004124 [Coemansia javaensis]|uniref:Uncharacterized protein n=1 Tax=Coemansia javaensis TaxID=2761396 RepID=A0A9W8LFB1_9FUNG|nr:hypothetical protein H4R18_004124 [Coemansia javaensis]